MQRQDVIIRKGKTEQETAKNLAAAALSPEVAALRVLRQTENKTTLAQLDIPTLAELLRSKTVDTEAMLTNQAIALQSLFCCLVEHAINNPVNFGAVMRLALKAQGQCRETLSTIQQNQELGVNYESQAMDNRAKTKAIRSYPPMATLGKINWTQNRRRQSQIRHERLQGQLPTKISGYN